MSLLVGPDRPDDVWNFEASILQIPVETALFVDDFAESTDGRLRPMVELLVSLVVTMCCGHHHRPKEY